MELFSKDDFRQLSDGGSDTPRVSIFMPTEKAGKETQQNSIRFKNLVREAEDRLEKTNGFKPTGAKQLLRPAYELIDDTPFWRHQEHGLALFLDGGGMRHYRVPITLNELVVVDRHFHLKPLLRLLTGDGRFLVLTLGQKQVRLFESTRYSIRELDLGDTPTSMEQVVGYEVEPQHLQFHTATAGGRGERPAQFHGQGGGEDDVKQEIRKFFAVVDRGVGQVIGNRDEPLVLAGLEFLLPIYRDVSALSQLVGEELRHNAQDLSPDDLRERVWEVVRPRFAAQRREARERYAELAGTGRTSSDLAQIVPAASDGRVETLFVASGTRRWGTYDEQARSIELHDEPGDGRRDLLDLAAVRTMAGNGRVFVVAPDEVPADGRALAAIYRY